MVVERGRWPGTARWRQRFAQSMYAAMLSPATFPNWQSPAWATLNHLLDQQPGAREKLRIHAGRIVQLRSGALTLTAKLDAHGRFAAVDNATPPDASLRVGFNSLLNRADPANLHTVRIDGDAVLAADVGRLLRALEWDFEDDLSTLAGPVAGRFLAQRVRAFDAWARRAGLSIGRQFAEYISYEAPLIAHAEALADFSARVSETRDAVERLEKRIAMLMTKA